MIFLSPSLCSLVFMCFYCFRVLIRNILLSDFMYFTYILGSYYLILSCLSFYIVLPYACVIHLTLNLQNELSAVHAAPIWNALPAKYRLQHSLEWIMRV